MLNVGNPSEAFRLGVLPTDGVGLARIEFIIASVVRVHPLALLHPEQVSDPAARDAIEALTRGYADPAEYFVDRLAEGVAVIAAAFYPRDVIVRLSDFKSNEYAGLLGGKAFEPVEANPMLGFRGAYRYAHPRYREGLRPRVPGDAAGARRDGPDQRQAHGPVLPDPRGGRARRGADGRARAPARRAWSRDLRDVRDPLERPPGDASSPGSSTASRSAPTTSPSWSWASTGTRSWSRRSSTSGTRPC